MLASLMAGKVLTALELLSAGVGGAHESSVFELGGRGNCASLGVNVDVGVLICIDAEEAVVAEAFIAEAVVVEAVVGGKGVRLHGEVAGYDVISIDATFSCRKLLVKWSSVEAARIAEVHRPEGFSDGVGGRKRGVDSPRVRCIVDGERLSIRDHRRNQQRYAGQR